MKVKIDGFINGDTIALKGSTSDTPVPFVVKGVELIAADELGFDSEDARYQILLSHDNDEYKWLPNKTSLKAIVAAFGDESDAWAGKMISIYLVDQNVSGKMKKVPYCVVK